MNILIPLALLILIDHPASYEGASTIASYYTYDNQIMIS